jgi:hypothetical protein
MGMKKEQQMMRNPTTDGSASITENGQESENG